MKKLIVLLLVIASYATSAQIFVQSTQASTERQRYYSYRGHVELDGIVGRAGTAGFGVSVANGVQFGPRIWVGLGFAVSPAYAQDKLFPRVPDQKRVENKVENPEYIYKYLKYWNVRRLAQEGDNKSFCEALYLETKVNVLKPGNGVVPFVKAAFGINIEAEAVYSHLKLGASILNAKGTVGLNFFAGMSLWHHWFDTYYSMNYSYKYRNDNWSQINLWYSSEGRITMRERAKVPLFFNAGLSFEFGGGGWLKDRPKKSR